MAGMWKLLGRVMSSQVDPLQQFKTEWDSIQKFYLEKRRTCVKGEWGG